MLVTIQNARPVGGTITAPPSKSMAHRAVLCAALAEGRSHITNLEFSKDISATLGAAAYFSDYLFVNVVRLNYLQLGIMIGGGYFILLTGTVFFSYFYYLKQYTVSQDLVRSYLEHIEVLGAFYQQNENGEENGDDTSISS